MRKIKSLLLAGLVLISFAACNNEEVPDGPGEGAKGKYDTYLTLTISSPTLISPRTEGPTTPAPAPEGTENDIANVHVYLVGNGGAIAHSAKLNVTNLKTDPFSVPTGTYNLFVVANPLTTDPLTGDIFAEVVAGVTNELAKGGYKNGTFLMTTACNEVTPLGEVVTINAQNTEDAPAEATAKVDRIAVKIVDKTKFTDITIDTNIEDLFATNSYKGFLLINGNEKINLFQKWQNLTGDAEGKAMLTAQGTVVNKLMTGYYNPITNYGLVTMASGKITAITDLAKGVGFATGKTYTVENRPDFMFTEDIHTITSGMATTTGVIYHFNTNAGNTFYVYRDKLYRTATEITALKALEELEDITNWNDTNAPAIRAKGVKVYESGRMYYSYYIEDQNYKIKNTKLTTPAQVKYNAVHRNSIYNLKITDIANIGDDVPGGGQITPENPNPPIITDKSYLKVTVEVNPWVLNNINVQL